MSDKLKVKPQRVDIDGLKGIAIESEIKSV